MRGQQAGRAPALVLLVGGENVQTEIGNTDNGVDLNVISTEKERVGDLQERVQAGVTRMEQAAERMGGRFQQAAPNAARLRRDPMVLLATGAAKVSAKETDEGVVISFTSDDPETVKILQEQMPQWVADARQRGETQMERMRRMQAARELLANEAVKIEVEETESGILLKVTSEDPELAKQIKENLPAYFEAQAEMARRGGPGLGARRGGPMGPGFGRGGQGFGPQGGMGRGRGGRGGRAGGPAGPPPEF
jgi:RPA family protein